MNFFDVDLDQETMDFNLENKRRTDALREAAQQPDPTDALTAEQILELYERSAAAKATQNAADAALEASKQFLAERPDYVKTPVNANRIATYLEAAGLDGTSPDHYHTAVSALAAKGLVRLDESKTPRQPRKRYSAADLEELPIEELYALAQNEARR
jgi:hypothetical protein